MVIVRYLIGLSLLLAPLSVHADTPSKAHQAMVQVIMAYGSAGAAQNAADERAGDEDPLTDYFYQQGEFYRNAAFDSWGMADAWHYGMGVEVDYGKAVMYYNQAYEEWVYATSNFDLAW